MSQHSTCQVFAFFNVYIFCILQVEKWPGHEVRRSSPAEGPEKSDTSPGGFLGFRDAGASF